MSQRGYFIINIGPEKQGLYKKDILEGFRRVSARDYLFLTIHLRHAVDAGMPILRSLNTIAEEIKSLKLKSALRAVSRDLAGGSSFSDALRKHPKVFNDFFVNMVAAGETSGQLGYVLEKIGIHFEKQNEFRQKIVSSLAYPAFLAVISIGVVTLITVYIMPKFVDLFESAEAALPLPTTILITISYVITNYWYYIIGTVVCLSLALKTYIGTRAGRFRVDAIKLKLPLFGMLFKKIYITNFLRTLATLYNSGIPILTALRVVEGTIGNSVYVKTVKDIMSHITEGRGLIEPLRASGLFPSEVLMLVSAGEESGKLGEMLQKNVELYEKDIEYELKNIANMIEPFIIVVMAGLVAFIAFSVLFPIFRLSKIIL